MLLLTFLGLGKDRDTPYTETTYTWNGRSEHTRFVAQALTRFFRIDTVLVALTERVEQSANWADLQACLAGQNLVPVRIPEGRNEKELWEVFRVLAGEIKADSHLVIDITHALRSIPVLAVALVTYLQRTHHVNVEQILYGAFELKDASGQAPVISLKPFLEVIEWDTAARFLEVSGDSRELAELLQSKKPGEPARKHGDALSRLGNDLRKLSGALAVNRPKEAAEDAHKVIVRLQGLPDKFEAASAPFTLIRKAVLETYAPIQDDDLEGTLQLVEWYVDRRRYLQAATLACEWLVSCAGQRLGAPCDNRQAREQISGSLAAMARKKYREEAGHRAVAATLFDLSSPEYHELVKAWNWVSQLRNDLAHCGYSRSAGSAKRIGSKCDTLPEALRALVHGA